MSSFGPDLSLKQCYLGKVDITILIWKLRNIVYLHTKLVVKLLLMAEDLLEYLDSLVQENFLRSPCLSSPWTVLRLCWHNVQREMLFSSGVVLYSVVLNLWTTRPHTVVLIWPLSSVSIFIILIFSMVAMVVAVKQYLIWRFFCLLNLWLQCNPKIFLFTQTCPVVCDNFRAQSSGSISCKICWLQTKKLSTANYSCIGSLHTSLLKSANKKAFS